MGKGIERRSLLFWPAAVVAAGRALDLRESQRLSFTGIGPIQIGMTVAQVRSVLSGKVKAVDLEEACSYLRPAVKGLAFMLLNARVARIDVTERPWLTDAGAGIGSSETEVRRLYPQLRIEAHPYLDPDQGHYLRVIPDVPKLKGYELLFETERGTVTTFRAGLSGAVSVSLIEGCS